MPTSKKHKLHHLVEDIQRGQRFTTPKCHHFHLNYLRSLSDGGLESRVHREVSLCDEKKKAYFVQRSSVIAQRFIQIYTGGSIGRGEIADLLSSAFKVTVHEPATNSGSPESQQ